jgi:hypothetical protein
MVKVKTAFTVLLMVSLLGIAACSDDDGDEGGTATGAEEAGTTAGGDETGTSAKESGEPILIKTHVAPPTRGTRRLARFFPGPPSATQPSAPGGNSSMGLWSQIGRW